MPWLHRLVPRRVLRAPSLKLASISHPSHARRRLLTRSTAAAEQSPQYPVTMPRRSPRALHTDVANDRLRRATVPSKRHRKDALSASLRAVTVATMPTHSPRGSGGASTSGAHHRLRRATVPTKRHMTVMRLNFRRLMPVRHTLSPRRPALLCELLLLTTGWLRRAMPDSLRAAYRPRS